METPGPDLDLSASTRLSGQHHAGPAAHELQVPVLMVLAHPDRHRIGERVALPELFSGATVRLSRSEPLFCRPNADSSAPLADNHLSRKPILLSQDAESGETIVDPARSSTPIRLAGQVVEARQLLSAGAVERGITLELGHYLALLLHLGPPLDLRLPHYDREGNISSAIEDFQRDLAVDSSFAPALAGLARAYWLDFRNVNRDPARLEQASAVAERAVSLDPFLAGGWISRAMALPPSLPSSWCPRDLPVEFRNRNGVGETGKGRKRSGTRSTPIGAEFEEIAVALRRSDEASGWKGVSPTATKAEDAAYSPPWSRNAQANSLSSSAGGPF